MEKSKEEVVYKPKSGFSHKLNPENEEKKKTCLFLYFTSFIINMLPISFGVAAAWTSPVSSKLLSRDSSINPLGTPITAFQLSLLGGLPAIGTLVGPLIFGKLFDIFGRKKPLMISSSLIITFLSVIAFSENIYVYYVSLIFTGIGLGGGLVGTTMYLSEMTEDHNRAAFACFMGLGVPIGNLFSFLLGPFLSVRFFTLSCTIPAVIHFIGFATILPESPLYFVMRKDIKGARKALSKFRRKSDGGIVDEIEMIEQMLNASSKSGETGIAFILKYKAAKKALFITMGIFIFSFLNGMPAMMAFLELIFNKAGSSISGYLCAIISGLIQVSCALVASQVVDILGRRTLLLTSSVLCALPLFVLGLFFYLKQHDFSVVEHLGWLPITSFILLLIFNAIGYGSVPMILLCEMYPNEIKSIALAVTCFSNFLVVGLVIFSFPIMLENFGSAWTFWTYSTMCGLGSLFIYAMLPETKGKSLIEIQDILSK
ncbi:hypothetical protein JTB14_021870 [Gonioctena quinquepunctata]|nr:hypothetical protein JTB14_021870 [Gonioctena quinquepunctata]